MAAEYSPSDNGSVLLWVVGCAAIALLVVTALTQIVASTHQRRLLQYATDAAALAAANQLELSSFRNSGNLADISIARAVARDIIITRLAESPTPIRIDALVFTSDEVWLRTSQAINSELGWGLAARSRVSAQTSVALSQAP